MISYGSNRLDEYLQLTPVLPRLSTIESRYGVEPEGHRAEGEEGRQGWGEAPSGFARGAGREWPSPHGVLR